MKVGISALFFLMMPLASFAQLRLPPAKDSSLHSVVLIPRSGFDIRVSQPVPDNYYAKHLGFFCRQELKMQKAHIPISFRIGTMDQCNYLEQKPGYKIN